GPLVLKNLLSRFYLQAIQPPVRGTDINAIAHDHRRAIDPLLRREAPQLLARLRIERFDPPRPAAHNDDAAPNRRRAPVRLRRALVLRLPCYLGVLPIDRKKSSALGAEIYIVVQHRRRYARRRLDRHTGSLLPFVQVDDVQPAVAPGDK